MLPIISRQNFFCILFSIYFFICFSSSASSHASETLTRQYGYVTFYLIDDAWTALPVYNFEEKFHPEDDTEVIKGFIEGDDLVISTFPKSFCLKTKISQKSDSGNGNVCFSSNLVLMRENTEIAIQELIIKSNPFLSKKRKWDTSIAGIEQHLQDLREAQDNGQCALDLLSVWSWPKDPKDRLAPSDLDRIISAIPAQDREKALPYLLPFTSFELLKVATKKEWENRLFLNASLSQETEILLWQLNKLPYYDAHITEIHFKHFDFKSLLNIFQHTAPEPISHIFVGSKIQLISEMENEYNKMELLKLIINEKDALIGFEDLISLFQEEENKLFIIKKTASAINSSNCESVGRFSSILNSDERIVEFILSAPHIPCTSLSDLILKIEKTENIIATIKSMPKEKKFLTNTTFFELCNKFASSDLSQEKVDQAILSILPYTLSYQGKSN